MIQKDLKDKNLMQQQNRKENDTGRQKIQWFQKGQRDAKPKKDNKRQQLKQNTKKQNGETFISQGIFFFIPYLV